MGVVVVVVILFWVLTWHKSKISKLRYFSFLDANVAPMVMWRWG